MTFKSLLKRIRPGGAKFWRTVRNLLLAFIVIALLVIGISIAVAEANAAPHIFTADTLPAVKVAIVFGAGLQRDGTPSPILRDRISMAVELYKSGKVQKIIMSGDNRFVYYNEPGAMHDYAVQLGVKDADIVLDYAGRRTYDTCYRARHIFNVEQAVLVTQRYHLTRAIFTCRSLGIDASGVAADMRRFRFSQMATWQTREVLATPVALWEVWVERPLPVLGLPEPIFNDYDYN